MPLGKRKGYPVCGVSYIKIVLITGWRWQ